MGNDNASSALKFAIGLVITMIFIGIVIVAFTFGRNHANNAISNMSKDTSQLEEGRYTQYDGVIVTGAEVLNIIEKFEADNIAISVKTAPTTRAGLTSLTTTSTGDHWFIKNGLTAADKMSTTDEDTAVRNAKDIAQASYINPSAEFYGIVNRAADTGAIQGISFFRIEG